MRTSGGAAESANARWLATALAPHARSEYRPGARFAIVGRLTSGATRAPDAERVAVSSVKYAPHQAPVAAYGFTTCAGAVGEAVLTA